MRACVCVCVCVWYLLVLWDHGFGLIKSSFHTGVQNKTSLYERINCTSLLNLPRNDIVRGMEDTFWYLCRCRSCQNKVKDSFEDSFVFIFRVSQVPLTTLNITDWNLSRNWLSFLHLHYFSQCKWWINSNRTWFSLFYLFFSCLCHFSFFTSFLVSFPSNPYASNIDIHFLAKIYFQKNIPQHKFWHCKNNFENKDTSHIVARAFYYNPFPPQ